MKYVPSPLFESFSGKVGSAVASNWKGKKYIRTAASTISNPQTVPQSRQRDAVSELSKVWRKDLTKEQRDGWDEYAKGKGSQSTQVDQSDGGQGIIPQIGTLQSGYNAFIGAGLLRAAIGCSPADCVLSDAPIGTAAPTPPTNLTAVYDPVSDCIQISYNKPIEPGPVHTYADSQGDTIVEEPKVRIWIKPQVSYSRIDQLNEIPGNGAPNEECTCEVTGYPVVASLPIGVYFVQADCVNPHGQKSAPSNLVEVEKPQCCQPWPIAVSNPQYDDDAFTFAVNKTQVDSVCPADFIQVSIKDTNGDTFEFNVPREEWTDNNGNYTISVFWADAPDGDYYMAARSGTFCGKYTAWTTPQLVHIGV